MDIQLTNSEYFNSLPKYIQEGIMQSGVDFQDDTELRRFVAAIEAN